VDQANSAEPQCLSEFFGTTAVVVDLDLPESESRRLKSLGVFVGQSIELQRAGNSLILAAAGGRVAIAQDIARRIVVQPCESRPA
jgi:Fe2+ transport system protein FeoA